MNRRPFFPSLFPAHLLWLVLLFPFHIVHAQSGADRVRIDSIFQAIEKMPADTNTVNYINKVYNDYLWQFNLPESYNKLKYAARLSRKLAFDRGEYVSYSNMAGFSLRLGNNDYELQNRLKALEAAKRLDDSVRMAGQWFGVGVAYHGMGKDSLALRYELDAEQELERSVDTSTDKGKDKMARIYLFIAWTYQTYGNDSAALNYILRSYKLREALHYDDGELSCIGTLRQLYIDFRDYDKAMSFSREALKIESRRNNAKGIAESYVSIGEVHLLEGKADSALFFFYKAEKIAQELHQPALLRNIYKGLADALEKKGNVAASYSYFREYTHLKDSLLERETANRRASDKEMYDIASKNAEIELLNKDKELQYRDIAEQKRTLWGMALILAVTLALAVIIFTGYRRKKRTAKDLALQKKIIEEKNNDITNSIVYAQRIQHAILPSLKQIRDALPQSFVLYRPKDIVSGDFFWFNETADSYYIAAVDCTGHGVPGALMSMIGYSFLGQVVNEMKITQTAEILNELHRKILLALNKDLSSRDIKDGMDVALCRIFKGSNEIEFSGAVRPLYSIENGELRIIKGDIFSVGGVKDADRESFSSHRFSLARGSSIYLFSDGYADQFGGPAGKKFKYHRLRELLLSVHTLPAEEQEKKIEKTFEDWKGNRWQVDDVMVIGVKIG